MFSSLFFFFFFFFSFIYFHLLQFLKIKDIQKYDRTIANGDIQSAKGPLSYLTLSAAYFPQWVEGALNLTHSPSGIVDAKKNVQKSMPFSAVFMRNSVLLCLQTRFGIEL